MMAKSFEFKTKNFEELRKLLDKASFSKRMRRTVRKATKKNGLLAEAAIKEAIAAGDFKANANMTQALKGSNRPLVDSGDLFKAINARNVSWKQSHVGVLKQEIRRDRETGATRDLVEVASILHNGAVVTVTDKMRKFFAVMARKHEQGETKKPWKPLKATTTVIVIPARPFLDAALTAKMKKIYGDNWERAVEKAMAGKR